MSTEQMSIQQQFVPKNGVTVTTVLTALGVLLVLTALIFGGNGLGVFDGVMAAMVGTYGLLFLVGSVAVRLFPIIIKAVR